MASRQFFRNLLNLDDKLVAIEAAIKFNASGAPVLQQWVPPAAGSSLSSGYYQDAPIGGCEGITRIEKLGTGDFKVVFQDSYQRLKGLLPTYKNSKNLGIAASIVQEWAGEIADGHPDLTDFHAERLAAGASGTAVAAVQPTFTVSSGTFAAAFIGSTFTDSAGTEFEILDADGGDTLSLSGITTPATGAGWKITVGGVVILTSADEGGARSSTGFVAATFTVGGATWLVNRFVGMRLNDSAGNSFLIQSNTATVLTLHKIDQGTNPTTGSFTITNTWDAGQLYTVTGTAQVAGAPTGTGTANTFTPTAHVNWVAGIFANMFLVDSAGVQWLITENSTTALTVASNGANTTPADGAFSIVAIAGAASLEFTTKALSGSGSALTAAAQIFTGSSISGGAISGGVAAAQLNNGALANAVETIAAGIGGTSTGSVVTVTGGGAIISAHALAGQWFTDGTGTFLILDNSALTATTGTITVLGAPAATITAGAVYKTVNDTSAVTGTPTGTPVGTNASSAVSGTLTASETATNPASGEFLLLTFVLSDGTVME
jgi:hypothetical protein